MKPQHRILVDLGFGALGVLLIICGIMCSSCGGYQEPQIRKSHDGGFSNFEWLEKINAHCKEWKEGQYVSPTGLKTYWYCVEW